ncbi:SUMF1/EgtB/PvdO family nonheme iron enzyme [Desertifilum sp. FACHB-1129]|uniref:SUMF1/EgtB/PvdO family nonheme iron enzyme n=1 Tax=Desertifilum sp. FACHB-1129 TaxID=2692795 RepID=UPI001689E600|nr:SUMF1/EgtB/PvdO family nonheme iron enzyme [Desertifilum sp. FACHB-1129]MBD2312031.1 SUMF1/EgtB/PvdO family nonheme iron enzyme [Desertifilum sp. FACHB-1129]
MTPDDPYLIHLFYDLKQAGLPLRIQEDYGLLRKAYSLGYIPQSLDELEELCEQLWVKSLAEKKIFDACFREYKSIKLQELTQQFKVKPKNRGKTKNNRRKASKSPLQPSTKEPVGSSEPSQNVNDFESDLADIQVGVAVPVAQSPSRASPRQKFVLNDEYFPVTRAQMQHGWRSLRKLMRQGRETEPDIARTIQRICQENIAELALRPTRINQTELLLFVDCSDSMAPFALISERLIETATQRNFFRRIQVFYFRNSPIDAVFTDVALLNKQPLDTLIASLHTSRTLAMIFSDAGAAKGGSSQARAELTQKFLTQVRAAVQQVVWLNPLPQERWLDNTAEVIACQVAMFPFSLSGWRELLQILRGQPATQVEFLESVQPLEESELGVLDELEEMMAASTADDYQYQEATERLERFVAEFPEYLSFACHAAFPLALTPDFLYYLRENFAPTLPWIVVSDLLLSGLCQPLGSRLYQMDSLTRHLLLKTLKASFGQSRLHKLSDALLFYLYQGLQERDLEVQELGEHPEWIALAYTEPTELAQQLAEKLQQTFTGEGGERVKAASLIATFAEPLAEANFKPLLTLARGIGRQARGYEQGAQEIFDQLLPELKFGKVTIQVPGKSGLKSFSFETVRVNRRGEEVERKTHQARYFTEDLGQGVMLEMVEIPGGTFWMGSPKGEGYGDEKPQHSVTVPAFFMAKYPVTQAQWRAVAALPQVERSLEADPARFKGDNRPVEQVSWFDAVEFCARLSKKVGREYSLPSEAQWEYACRAGTTTPFYFGETITTQLVNYDGNYTYAEEPKGEYRKKTTPVGSFPPNAFGLYDMHGNVREWCLDDWHDSYQGAPEDGSAWLDGNDNLSQKPNDSKAVLRGGSWIDNPDYCRSAFRYYDYILVRGNYGSNIGFRVVCVAGRTFNP